MDKDLAERKYKYNYENTSRKVVYQNIEYTIYDNMNTNGLSCEFEYMNNYYFADLSYVDDRHTYECMIFKTDKNGHVTDWHELYCKLDVNFNEQGLVSCIHEFKLAVKNNER